MWPVNATPAAHVAAFVDAAADEAFEEDAEAGAHGEHTTVAQLSRLVSVSVVPMLVLLGTFGNLLTLLVLLRPLNLLPRLPTSAGGRARQSKQQLGPSRARLNSGAAAAGKQTSVVSTVFYLCALSLLDLVYLYVGPALYWLFIAYDINVKGLSELSCRLVPFFGRLLSNMANWVIVLLTADRLIWVLFPFTAKGFCTLRNAAIALAGVTLSLLALYAVMPVAFSLQTMENARGRFALCQPSPAFDGIDKAISWIDLFAFSLLPFAIIFACNITIIYKLNQYRRIRANMNKYKKAGHENSAAPVILVTPHNQPADRRYSRVSYMTACSKSSSLPLATASSAPESPQPGDANVTLECSNGSSASAGPAKERATARKSACSTRSLNAGSSFQALPALAAGGSGQQQMHSSRERTLTLMLLTVSIFFIVTTLPITVLNLVFLVLNPNFNDPSIATIIGYYDLCQTIAQVLCFTNNSLYFWLYCMSGSHFRRQVRNMFEPLCAPLVEPCGRLCARLCGQREGQWCRLPCVNCAYDRRGSQSGDSLRVGEGTTLVDRLTTPTRPTTASENSRRDPDADDDADGLRFTAPPAPPAPQLTPPEGSHSH